MKSNSGQKKMILQMDIGSDSKGVKLAIEEIKKVAPDVAFLGISADNEKLTCFSYVPDTMTGEVKANEWVATTLEVIGGKGGGRVNMAQGSAPTGSDQKRNAALESAMAQAATIMN